MTLAEYMRLTDLRAVRTARHAIHDIVDHQKAARLMSCEVILDTLDVWIKNLRDEVTDGKDAPSDADKP